MFGEIILVSSIALEMSLPPTHIRTFFCTGHRIIPSTWLITYGVSGPNSGATKKVPVPRMITPQPVGISIIAPYATMCFIKYNWKTVIGRVNATLNANPCQFGRDACFLLPVYQHVHLTLSAPNYRREQKYLSWLYRKQMPMPMPAEQPTTCLKQMRRKPSRRAYLISGFALTCRCPKARYHLLVLNKRNLLACVRTYTDFLTNSCQPEK